MTLFIAAGSEGSSTIRQRQVQLPVPAGGSSIERFGNFPKILRHFAALKNRSSVKYSWMMFDCDKFSICIYLQSSDFFICIQQVKDLSQISKVSVNRSLTVLTF